MDGWVGGGTGRCEGPTSVNKSDLHTQCCQSHIHLHLPCPALALPLGGLQWPQAQPDALPSQHSCAPQPECTRGSLPPAWPAAANPSVSVPRCCHWAGAELVAPLSWAPFSHSRPPTRACAPARELGLPSFGCALGLTCHLNNFTPASSRVLNLVNSVQLCLKIPSCLFNF